MPVTVGIVNQLTTAPAVAELLDDDSGGFNNLAAYIGAKVTKSPAIPYLVIHGIDLPPAEHTMQGPTSMSDGEFQFDSFGPDQATARGLSQAVRDLLKNFSGLLPDGTSIQFYEVTKDSDEGYDQGGTGYEFRCLLRLKAFFTEPGE